jgi:N-acetylmuramic acid 6-phosphate etherase
MSNKKLFSQLTTLLTEQRNPAARNLESLTTRQILNLINAEDKKIATAVDYAVPQIEKAVKCVVESFRAGGRLIYVGAGTSGRLGVLDASECPPTFGMKPTLVQGIIAGGKKAVFKSVEGAEDDEFGGRAALKKIKLTKKDTVVGITASRRTPFVVAAVAFAREVGSATVFLTSNKNVDVKCDVVIQTLVGPEVIMGSTRMKAGTSHKLVLNMISTTAMIQMGKTYQGMMVDLQQTNKKLVERTKRIFMMATDSNYATAEKYLKQSGGKLKTALVMRLANLSRKQAEARLKQANGFVKDAIKVEET